MRSEERFAAMGPLDIGYQKAFAVPQQWNYDREHD
jgi:hypothetical protein